MYILFIIVIILVGLFLYIFAWKPMKFRSQVDFACGEIRNHATENVKKLQLKVTKEMYQEIWYQLRDLKKVISVNYNELDKEVTYFKKTKRR